MTKFKYVGTHAETLGNGRPVGDGEELELSKDAQGDPVNSRLIDDGLLIELPQPKKRATAKPKAETKSDDSKT